MARLESEISRAVRDHICYRLQGMIHQPNDPPIQLTPPQSFVSCDLLYVQYELMPQHTRITSTGIEPDAQTTNQHKLVKMWEPFRLQHVCTVMHKWQAQIHKRFLSHRSLKVWQLSSWFWLLWKRRHILLTKNGLPLSCALLWCAHASTLFSDNRMHKTYASA